MIPAMMLAGMAAGALWAFIPGLLKARFQVNEIISTLMLNYIAIAWNDFFIFGVWSEGGFQMSPTFPRGAWLPRLADFARSVRAFSGLTTHLGLLFALIAAVLVWWLLARSRWGYEIRLIGDNERAAEYAGIPIAHYTVLIMMLSGALAGLAGMSEISGVVHRLQGAISPGYGFTAIIVAFLGRLNPLAILVAGFALALSYLGGEQAQILLGMSSRSARVFQGMLLFFVLACDTFILYRVRIQRSLPQLHAVAMGAADGRG